MMWTYNFKLEDKQFLNLLSYHLDNLSWLTLIYYFSKQDLRLKIRFIFKLTYKVHKSVQ